jgi:tRNA (guanine-N7-)-methyltransferase
MNPKKLKCPFRWDDRRPIIHERVLFVPKYYDRHQEWTFPGWEDPSLFGKQAKLFIEYCSGNGNWVVQKALENPDTHWVAVEQRFDRVRKIWSKMHNEKVSNLIVVCGEAQPFTRHYLASASIQGIYINFPDPWPKTKHAKNRLIQQPFVSELSRVVVKEGSATFATDDETYCGQMVSEMLESEVWDSTFPSPHFVHDWPGYGTSYFDTLWREKGKNIHYLSFSNRGMGG